MRFKAVRISYRPISGSGQRQRGGCERAKINVQRAEQNTIERETCQRCQSVIPWIRCTNKIKRGAHTKKQHEKKKPEIGNRKGNKRKTNVFEQNPREGNNMLQCMPPASLAPRSRTCTLASERDKSQIGGVLRQKEKKMPPVLVEGR